MKQILKNIITDMDGKTTELSIVSSVEMPQALLQALVEKHREGKTVHHEVTTVQLIDRGCVDVIELTRDANGKKATHTRRMELRND